MKRVEGRVAIVTGASSGIGQATAEVFAREGAKVVVACHNTTRGPEVVAGIKRQGGEAIFAAADMGIYADIERMVKAAVDKWGKVDILVNNAGVGGEGDDTTTEEKWNRVVAVDLTGPFLASQLCVPYMKKQNWGNIVNVSSDGALKAVGRASSYSVTKGGLLMLTRNQARMYGKYNIRVNAVCPGIIATRMSFKSLGHYPPTEEEMKKWSAERASQIPIPLGKTGIPEEVAYPILFLCSEEASHITGVVIPIDGGMMA